MDPSDEFVLIDSINGTLCTMEHNRKSLEIEMYKILKGEMVKNSFLMEKLDFL
jgi:hypothetical protein